MGGLETYVKQLTPALVDLRPGWRVSIFVNPHGRDDLAKEPWAGSVELVSHPLLGRRYTRALSEMTILGPLAASRGVDLLHSLGQTGPLRCKMPNVLTVADVIWLHHPDPAMRTTFRVWKTVIPTMARRADRVITISAASREDIVRELGVPRERVDVVALGFGVPRVADPTPEEEIRRRFGLGRGPIVLTVSAIKAHKNLSRLVQAMAEVRERHPSTKLVIVGKPTSHQAPLLRQAAALGIADAVHFPGWIDASDLEGLYRCAACFVLPSLREGFGLPVLEAMARGVPVACSNVSALPEVAGDAAQYFDPADHGEIAAAVDALLERRDLVARLVSAGEQRQARFTWRATAEATLETYGRACRAWGR